MKLILNISSKMLKILRGYALLFSILISLISCKNQVEKHPSILDFTQFPLKNLSEYGFFKGNIANLEPQKDVLFYEPIAPLFSDYAYKKRFVWMPKSVSASFDISQPNKSFDFPDKTILIKTFYYPEDFSKPNDKKRLIETRLLVRNKGEWAAYPYRWNTEQTDASYKITGDLIDVAWKDEKGAAHAIKYAMPNKNQCKSCHSTAEKSTAENIGKGEFMPIGTKLKQLNNTISYAEGAENQLDKWIKVGYLKGDLNKNTIINLVNPNDTHASIDLKARSYLDVNCGHCHNAKGPAATSGLHLNIEEHDPFHWGVMKSPVAAGIGAGDFKFDILPKKADESIITFRMNSVNPGIMMPEIGRISIHTEGVALVKDWINSLK